MSDTRIGRAWRRLAPGPRGRRVLVIVGALLAAITVLALAQRYVRGENPFVLGLVAATPYLMLAGPVAAVLFVVARQWIGATVAVVLVIACVATQVSLFVASDPPEDARPVVVMSANLHVGTADASAVVAAVRRHGVEVLSLQELTPEIQSRLVAAGLDRALPYHRAVARGFGAGTGLWSRYPLADEREPAGYGFALVTARVAIPGVGRPPTVVALHMSGPVPATAEWQRDIARLRETLNVLPGDAPVIAAGDFNATPDTVQFRALLSGGYGDAGDQAGAGYTPTYPADRWFPPLIAIDHVVTRGGAVATSVDSLHIPDTDHRALIVRVALPRRP